MPEVVPRLRRANRRLIAAAATAVLAAALAVSTAAAQQGAPYADVPADAYYAIPVSALAADGILAGTDCGEGRFCPDDPLPRWVMAVWLVRALDGRAPEPSGESSYADVDPARWWSPYTSRLADLGVTSGCLRDPPRYCPDRPVTRGQMATFLAIAFDLPGGTPGRFSDTARSVHAHNIDKLAEAGITAGCGQDRYCPDRQVTRAQMATFLAHALKLVPHPDATPLADDYRLAYSTKAPGGPTEGRYGWASQLWMAGPQGSREFIGWYGAAGGDRPIFSPDGKWVAYGINDKAYVLNTETSNVREVRARGRWSYNFRWSPDSKHLVYNPADGAAGTSWIEGSDGQNKRSIGLFWRFSPDGRFGLTSAYDEVGEERIYSHTVVEDLETGSQVRIDVDESNARYAVFTPDSQRVSWIAQHPTGSQQDLWVMDVDGSNKTKLLTAVVGDLPGSAKVRWSPDGTRFAYVRGVGGIGTQFLVADAANGNTIMNLGISKCNYLQWAPDSAHLISDNRDGVVFNTQTGETIRASDLYTGDPGKFSYIRSVRWSPDNRAFAYILEEATPSDSTTLPYDDISTQLWIADADGQNNRMLVDSAGYDFRWSPDGERIAYSILSPYGVEIYEGEAYPLSRFATELWIADSDGSDRWRVSKRLGVTLLGWLPG